MKFPNWPGTSNDSKHSGQRIFSNREKDAISTSSPQCGQSDRSIRSVSIPEWDVFSAMGAKGSTLTVSAHP